MKSGKLSGQLIFHETTNAAANEKHTQAVERNLKVAPKLTYK